MQCGLAMNIPILEFKMRTRIISFIRYPLIKLTGPFKPIALKKTSATNTCSNESVIPYKISGILSSKNGQRSMNKYIISFCGFLSLGKANGTDHHSRAMSK